MAATRGSIEAPAGASTDLVVSPKRATAIANANKGAATSSSSATAYEWVAHDRTSLSLFDKEVKQSDMAMRYEFELDAFQKR